MKICYVSREFEMDHLKFLIDVVDTQLFKTVSLKNFKSIDIQDSDGICDLSSCHHGGVNSLNDPVEKLVIYGLCKGITNSSRLRDI